MIDVIKAAVANLPSATGRSIEEMWSHLHMESMKIDAMPDGEKKHDARAEHQRAVEKVLSHQFKLSNEARLKRKTPDPVRAAETKGLSV